MSLSPIRSVAVFLFAFALGLAHLPTARGQIIQQQVGGVTIDARGLVSKVQIDDLNELRRVRALAVQPVPGDLKVQALRKVSLRGLEAAIAEQRKNGVPLSDEMRYLAGLQRIQYVFVYPELNDVVLAGPGEGWRLNADGEVVGEKTHRPVMLLDDLLVALRSIDAARTTGINCSIDPTREGIAAFQALMKNVHRVDGEPDELMTAIEKSLGPQRVSVNGVPDVSHFARVLVAADYRMKRLAMAFEEPPIAGLPSYLHMLKSSKGGSAMPRWWLAPDYDALLADADGLAWELRRAGVKALTEDEVLEANGQRKRTGQASPLAKKWADNMTEHYDELCAKDAIFGQLRNCMDLAVVAALISHQHLTEKCGWSMPLLLNPDLPVESYNAPRQVDTQASVLQKGSNWIISASGGVQINPWQPLEKTQPSPTLSADRAKATPPGPAWWWN